MGSAMTGILNSHNGVNVTQSPTLQGVNGNQYAKENRRSIIMQGEGKKASSSLSGKAPNFYFSVLTAF
jgi:hypothetical protein